MARFGRRMPNNCECEFRRVDQMARERDNKSSQVKSNGHELLFTASGNSSAETGGTTSSAHPGGASTSLPYQVGITAHTLANVRTRQMSRHAAPACTRCCKSDLDAWYLSHVKCAGSCGRAICESCEVDPQQQSFIVCPGCTRAFCADANVCTSVRECHSCAQMFCDECLTMPNANGACRACTENEAAAAAPRDEAEAAPLADEATLEALSVLLGVMGLSDLSTHVRSALGVGVAQQTV